MRAPFLRPCGIAESGTLRSYPMPGIVRRSRYAFRKPVARRCLAELGTPQKWVRPRAASRLAAIAQKRVRRRGTRPLDRRVSGLMCLFGCFWPTLHAAVAQKRVRPRSLSLWIRLCNVEVIPAESGSALALKRVRVYADSGSRLRRIEYAAPQNQVRTGSVYVYRSRA